MLEITPFRAWRYNSKKIKNPASVLAPPYDVISPKEQRELYRKSPYNVVRLILGEKSRKDSASDNRYTRARRFFESWMAQGVLTQDLKPAVYVYVQNYKDAGKPRERTGFIVAMRLNEKMVLRHENTLAKPKQDRMALIREVQANLSPVFGLFEDARGDVREILEKIKSKKPDVDVTLGGTRHRLYVESDKGLVGSLAGRMRSKSVYIADGHHRFEVACRFRDRMRKFSKKGLKPWDYVLMYLSDFRHNPFTIYPTHRLVKTALGKKALSALAKRGTLKKVKNLRTILGVLSKPRSGSANQPYRFGVYMKKEGFFLFDLDSAYAPRPGTGPVQKLDVAVLHDSLLRPCFGIRTVEKSADIDFTRDPEAGREKVRCGEFSMAFFLRPTSLEEIVLVSKKGLKMPQKSTYFYPKLLSGLVFHRFNDPTTSF